MKKTNLLLRGILKTVLLTLTFSIVLFGCKKTSDTSTECKKTEAEEFTLRINPDIVVVHSDNSPYEGGTIQINIYKEYCSGEISGNFTKNVETNSSGEAKFFYFYEYKFANTKDEVWFDYIIDGKLTSDGDAKHTGYISYLKAASATEIGDGLRIFSIQDDYYNGDPLIED